MFICAKYGLFHKNEKSEDVFDKEYFLNTNCSSAVLSDYVQERTVRDTLQALGERFEQEKKEKARVIKLYQNQKRGLDGMVLELRDLEKAPADAEAAQERKAILEEELEKKKKDMESLEGERKAREDAMVLLEEKLEVVGQIKRVELVEEGGGPVQLKEPEQKTGGDLAAKFLAPRSSVRVKAYYDEQGEEEVAERDFDLSFEIPPIEAVQVEAH
jgi:hypothetical protein